LFCHITSWVEDDPHAKLLSEKGGDAFPYIVFMDGDGDVVTQYNSSRSTEGFRAAAQAVGKYLRLRDSADSPDAAVRVELLMAQLELGVLGHGEARAKAEQLEKLENYEEAVTEEARARLKQRLVNLEFQAFLDSLPADKPRSEIVEIAAKGIFARQDRGEIPDGNDGITFFNIQMMYGEQTGDAQLVEAAASKLKKQLDPQDAMHMRIIDQVDRRVAKAKEKAKDK